MPFGNKTTLLLDNSRGNIGGLGGAGTTLGGCAISSIGGADGDGNGLSASALGRGGRGGPAFGRGGMGGPKPRARASVGS